MHPVLAQATERHRQGDRAEAERLYRVVLADTPDQPDALALLGALLSETGAYGEAIALLEKAVMCDPAAALFRFYLGNACDGAGDTERAARAFEEAVARQPDFGEAWLALADVALKNKNLRQSCDAAAHAVRLLPQNMAAFIAQGLAFDLLGREEEALLSFQRAAALTPDYPNVHDMLGTTCQNLGRLDEAGHAFDAAIKAAGGTMPDNDCDEREYTVHHWNLALLELLRGDFRNGFAHYRARFKNSGRPPRLPYPQPLWQGENPAGKKILVVGEQGFGDVLMLCRYAALLKARGAIVVFLVHPALAALLAQNPVVDAVITEPPAAQGDFDFQASIFDLPYGFGTVVENIPAAIPYLPTPAPDATTRLPPGPQPRIGVVWAGRPDYGDDRRRSIPLDIFADLFGGSRARFFGLMPALRPGDAEILARHSVTDLGSLLHDFLATARLVGQLDLVITCDTSVAHLAGAMGKPVWLLLPFAPDWRWLTDREDSPWYPTMRLFRQTRKSDWREVVARVRAALMQDFPVSPA